MGKADKTYMLAADRKTVLPEDHPDAAFLLARKGTELEQEVAEQYGLPLEFKKTKPAKVE